MSESMQAPQGAAGQAAARRQHPVCEGSLLRGAGRAADLLAAAHPAGRADQSRRAGPPHPGRAERVRGDARDPRRGERAAGRRPRSSQRSASGGGQRTVFIAELAYAGIFTLNGVPENSVEPVLLVECPRLLFPFARTILADVTREGGFAPGAAPADRFRRPLAEPARPGRRRRTDRDGLEHRGESNFIRPNGSDVALEHFPTG